MAIFISHLLRNKSIAKLNALFIALFIWSLMNSWRILQKNYDVIVKCNTSYPLNNTIQKFKVTLKGPRSILHKINKTITRTLTFSETETPNLSCQLTSKHLGLPNNVKLISSNPSHITLQ